MIRAGTAEEAQQNSGKWIFVDLGFSAGKRSCGLLIGNDQPEEVTFSNLKTKLLKVISTERSPINLLIEAPLSIAFNSKGNPTGRLIEKRASNTRYWYVGLGCCVLVAATHLLRAINDANPRSEVRLFEGFASFKDNVTTHSEDVLALKKVIWRDETASGRIVSADDLRKTPEDELISAFAVSGMNFGIPAVVVLN